jgi:PAS domain S-box-containing protein
MLSAEHLEAIVDCIGEPIVVEDQHHRFVFVNRAACRVSGIPREQWLGKTLYDIFPEEQAEVFRRHDDLVLATGERDVNEEEFTDGWGNVRTTITTKTLCVVPTGEKYIVLTARDITGSKRTEIALRESEERYRTVFENTAAATVIIEKDATISLANAEFERLSGYTKTEIEGKKTWKDFTAAEDIQPMVEQHRRRRLSRDETLSRYEFRFLTRMGELRDIHMAVDTIPGSGKSVASLIDITDQKSLRRAFEEDREKFRLLFEKSADPIVLLDDSGIMDCNQAAVQLLGCPGKSRLIGLHPSDLSPKRQHDGRLSSEKEKEVIKVALREGMNRFEWIHRTFGGKDLWIDVSLTAIPFQGKRIIYTLWRDITERKHLESQLRQSQKMEAIGTLAGGVAHDFNNILMALMGYATMLKMKIGDKGLHNYVDQILSASQKATDLVSNLLAFSRQHAVRLKPVGIHRIIEESEKLLGRLLTEDIVIRTLLGPEDVTIMADRPRSTRYLQPLDECERRHAPGRLPHHRGEGGRAG